MSWIELQSFLHNYGIFIAWKSNFLMASSHMRWVHDKFENKVGYQNLGLSMFLVSYITTFLYIIYGY